MKILPRVFTLDEANTLLPELETLLTAVDERRSDTARRHDELLMEELLRAAEQPDEPATPCEPESHHPAEAFDSSVAALEKEIERIKNMGCVLRNLEPGWVDFLGCRDEERVYFCWRRGEKEIRFFHPVRRSTERFPLEALQPRNTCDEF